MTGLHQPKDVAVYNEESLEGLTQAIFLSEGFTLILVRCNYASVREQMVQRLQAQCPVEIRKLFLDKSVKTLYTTIKKEVIGDQQPPALMVLGLESVSDIDRVLAATNQVREEFRKNFPFPLILWVTDEVLRKLIRLVPDFESWATIYEFTIATDKLLEFLRQTTDEVFAKVLDAGAGKFLDNADLNLAIGSSRRSELESAQKDLQERGIRLELELEASLEFVLGRDASSSMEQSRQHYQRSLAFWQQSDNLERRGCLLFCLGLWWRTYAVLNRSDYAQACSRAKEYYQQCLEVFQQANRPDLEAKFINALGDVLQRLQRWDQLETVVKQALVLHQTYPNPVKLAFAYGLGAEVAVAKSAWKQAQEYAETALHILVNAAYVELIDESENDANSLSRARRYHRGWYLLLLAVSQQHLGQLSKALEYLKTAKKETKPQHDPPLYIRILETLRTLYFEQGEYLAAFELKQERRSIEQQYGFRAFIGAGHLQPQGQVVNTALAPLEQQATVAQAIAASGRQHDVGELIERVIRNDRVLTVIHGQSGVGKSSLIYAGLLPALKERGAGEQDALPVVLQSYTDWERDLGKYLTEALLESRGISLSASLNSKAAILEQLQKNQQHNLRTILIFDQLAQFFFVKDEVERQPFWEFLRDCINTSSVRVLLAIREDYLHYLLEAERLLKADGTKNDVLKDILSKNTRYYLDNFSPEQAKAVIKQLTERSQFYLEPELIDELVQDLARNSGEIRPIELQVVGAQLQREPKIQTLEKYRQLGPKAKEKLVQGFLEDVVKDCGPPNEYVARLVLYLLTDDKFTRPIRTRTELIAEANKSLDTDLADKEPELKLVLDIFVKSGLVSLLQEVHGERYQLVHDYLIDFIRKQNDEGVIAKYRAERIRRNFVEKQFKNLLKWFAVSSIVAASLTVLVSVGLVRRSQIDKINAISASSEALFASNQGFDALKEGLKAGRQLQSISWLRIDTNTKNQVVTTLQQAVYRVKEHNQLNGHNDTVFSVSFSPDGQTIASASGDNTVKLWNHDGTLIKTLEEHKDKVVSVSFSPDGQTIASASYDRTVKLWKATDGTLLNTLEGHSDQILAVSFSPDGKTVASASADKTVKLWKTADGTLLNTFEGHKDGVGRVEFSPDGQVFASASEDKTVKLWSRDGKLLKTLTDHDAAVLDVSFSPDGQTIASASGDNTVKLWSRDGKLLKTFTEHENRVYDVSFSPDGKILASASGDNTVKLWNRNGELFKTLTGHTDAVYRVNFSRDGKMLASGSRDNTVNLWKLDGTLLTTLKGHRDAVIDIDFSPKSKDQIFASASYDRTVKLWKLDNELFTILQGHKDWVSGVSFSPDSQTVASTSRDNTVKLWKRDGTLLKTLNGHGGWVVGVDFSPDGQMLASASWDQTVKLWQRNGILKTLTGHQERVSDVSFSPDGQTLASASYDKTIKLWNRDGTFKATLTGHKEGVVGVDFSPDGETIASASDDKTVKLWRRDGPLLKTLNGHGDQVYGVSFSPDGQMLASASADNTVKLWRRDGILLNTLDHRAAVFRVKFSPNSQIIASTSEDNTVKLWKRDGTLLITLIGHTASVFGTSFSPDGRTLASASNDKTVILWNLPDYSSKQPLDILVSRGCSRLDDYLKTQKEDRDLCDGIKPNY